MKVFVDTNLWGEYLHDRYPWIRSAIGNLLKKNWCIGYLVG